MKNKVFLCKLFLCLVLFTIGCTTKEKVVTSQNQDALLFKPLARSEPLLNINIIDRNGLSETISTKERLNRFEHVNFLSPQPYQKVLRVYAKDAQGDSCSIITSYHTNGQIKQYLENKNNRAYGAYCEWYTNGKLKLKTYVIAGIADIDEKSLLTWSFEGESKAFDEEGKLLTKMKYEKGKLEGEATTFHPNGQIAKIEPYTKGELDGEVKSYFPDGKLLDSCFFKQGVQDGEAIGYFTPETLSYKEKFQDGLLEQGSYFDKEGKLLSTVVKGQGKRTSYNELGNLEFQEFKDGLPEGEVTVFDANGFLTCRYFVKNGEKHGQEVRNHPPKPFMKKEEYKPIAKLSIDWYEGKIHGMVKTWYENGVQESQREMSQNQKQGMLTAWYQDSSLMLIEEYEKDKLLRGTYLKKGESTPTSSVEQGKGIATLFDSMGHFNRKIRYQDGRPLDTDGG